MVQINLNIGPDLKLKTVQGRISVVISKKAGNGLTVEGDGLYMEDTCCFNDEGFVDQSGDALRIGFDGPFSSKTSEGEYPKPGRVSANNTVHHIYTMDSDLKTIKGYRSVDCILPGDIIRVPLAALQNQKSVEDGIGAEAVEDANILAAETNAQSIALSSGYKERLTIPSSGNKFYIRSDSGGYSTAIEGTYPHTNGLNVFCNCVGYAVGRFHEIDNHTTFDYYYPNNPGATFNKVVAAGKLKTGSTPRVGAAVVWSNDGNSGHIAIVERVIDSNTILTSESAYGGTDFYMTTRSNSNGNWGSSRRCMGFIYHPNVSASATSSGSQTATTHYVPINPVDYKVEEKNGCYYVEGILIVNKTYRIPKSYGSGVDKTAKAAVDEMIKAAAKDGITLSICSDYRDYNYQKNLYESRGKSQGYDVTDRSTARPGHSEHQTGLAFDMNHASSAYNGCDWANWIVSNSWKYGLINRYPAGKEDITGYKREDWHVRYVGKEWAKKIHDSGLCLEEYFGLPSRYTREYSDGN